MSWQRLSDKAAAVGLAVRGALHPEDGDAAPKNTGTLVLLGPDEPRFWSIFTASQEARDAQPDPMDRWSKRVIRQLAVQLNGAAIFPSDGPPYPAFLHWAQRSGRAHLAPVGLMVHDDAGLFLSYRGALALPDRLPIPVAPRTPCLDCETRPCEMACPVSALTVDAAYDVPSCKAHVTSAGGTECLTKGCEVRRACPISQRFGRLDAQSAFHMCAFAKG
ncbi:MAG: ferredoxin [Rhodobacteraceae bacterium]|nr:ferredoxin [Paracoccaceae bacterium]